MKTMATELSCIGRGYELSMEILRLVWLSRRLDGICQVALKGVINASFDTVLQPQKMNLF